MSESALRGPERGGFGDLFAAEWIRIAAARWALLLLACGSAVTVASAWYFSRRVLLTPLGRADFDPLHKAFDAGAWSLVCAGAAVLGVLTVAGEYASGSLRTTFVAVPARGRVVAAKAAVVAVVALIAGSVTSVTAFATSQAQLSNVGLGVSIRDAGAARAVVVSAVFPAVCGLIGIAVGAVVRHLAGAVATACGVLVLLPSFLPSDNHGWSGALSTAMPTHAWLGLARIRPPENGSYPTPTVAAVVLAAWAAGALAVAVGAVVRRDQ
ncbi:ABC transporter permease [Yinghuangia seranimata]|uniref:ABC transporter permease n=1 Tax=Yinghuangia seranimata TaxID=408067 RepID=UPI00248B1590|nr:ABC transporter permease [Yinghuangia seranimata]MDI2130374.1 ABC transporter permease [Yinghuangia seranimata]